MKKTMSLLVLLALAISLTAQSARSGKHSQAYSSASAKIDQVQSDANGGKTQTTQFTAKELSAFVNEGGVNLPTGVESVTFSSNPGVITALTKVDFDKITAGRSSMNPLMMLFTGVHDVTVTADGQGSGGRATVNVESVQIDGVTVPRTALEYFISKYLQPKYGNNVGLNNVFEMPSHVETAIVGDNTLTITQR
jgi:hypothetical protein